MAKLTDEQIEQRMQDIKARKKQEFEQGYKKLVQDTGYELSPQIVLSNGMLPQGQLAIVESQGQ